MTVTNLRPDLEEKVAGFLREAAGLEDVDFFIFGAPINTPHGMQIKMVVFMSIRSPLLTQPVIPGAVLAEFNDSDDSLKKALFDNLQTMLQARSQMLQVPQTPNGAVQLPPFRPLQ